MPRCALNFRRFYRMHSVRSVRAGLGVRRFGYKRIRCGQWCNIRIVFAPTVLSAGHTVLSACPAFSARAVQICRLDWLGHALILARGIYETVSLYPKISACFPRCVNLCKTRTKTVYAKRVIVVIKPCVTLQ